MSPPLLRVALTGGIAMGKSHCLARFASLGLPVIDADQLARDVVKAGSPVLEAVARRFGPSVLRADGDLNRPALAEIVFRDPASRSDLEAMLHPLVYAAIQAWFESLSSLPVASGAPGVSQRPRAQAVAMADIPLLYETGREADVDLVVVAACRPEQQLQRMIERGYTRADATARLAAQLPIEEKRQRADYVIDTSGTMEETDRQIAAVHGKLVNR